jgi:hypothetical protein
MTPSYDDQLVVINLSLVLFFTTVMFMIIFIDLHALREKLALVTGVDRLW